MEYEIHTTKKTLRKYRVHIIIVLLVLVIIGIIIAIGVHKPEGQKEQQDEQNVSPPISSTPEESTPSTPPAPVIQEHTQTIDIRDFKVINTYVREGKQYYTYDKF